MPAWDEIARDNLWAAKRLQRMHQERPERDCSRTVVSRCYYSAFSALTQALTGLAEFRSGRETPDHKLVSGLLQQHLSGRMARHRLRELQATVRRLYSARLDADYRSGVSTQPLVLNAMRDASKVLRGLGVSE